MTIKVPDKLLELVEQAGDRLPELLARSLREPTLPAHVYRYMSDFLASQPTLEQVAAFCTPHQLALDELRLPLRIISR